MAPARQLFDGVVGPGASVSMAQAASTRVFSRVLIYTTWFLGYITSIFNIQRTFKPSPVQSFLKTEYLLGVGIGDVTGPVVETNMFGYASMAQTDSGLHMRQWSRAFVVADANDPSNRFVYINSDISAGDTAVRRGILDRLDKLVPGVYRDANLALVGTHSHSGVGGYVNNLLPQLTSLGFVRLTYEAIVNGTVEAVLQAHNSLRPGRLSLGNATVEDASINRSPFSYLANPADERALYPGDVDKTMSLLRFDDTSGTPMGFLSFFAVHGTSIYENNTLISTDNKGMAAYMHESFMEPLALPGKSKFVAGFSQSTSGDISPNTLGAFCESPGKPWHGRPCDIHHSTCGNRTQECHGRGPGFRDSDMKSNEIIGSHQFAVAKTLMASTDLRPLSGAVKSLHTFVDMSGYSFRLPNGTKVTTCSPALGYGFAGGTTDGPGAFDFIQGANSTSHRNPFWEVVKGAVTPPPSEEAKKCHYPKPILLNVGSAQKPYQWSPSIVDIQVLRVGQLVILVLPSEFTTMSGRRLRNVVRARLLQEGILSDDAYVIAVGPANIYAHYTTTLEEYSVQRYEGASTLYGPNTLEAYIDIYTNLIPFLADGATTYPPPGPMIEDLSPKAISLQKPVVLDRVPLFRSFGMVTKDALPVYSPGSTVEVIFQGANPRNDLHLGGTFLVVERQEGKDWKVVRTDSHPSTTFRWTRTNEPLGYSVVAINWAIEKSTPGGAYRIVYRGDARHLLSGVQPFTGYSSSFLVRPSSVISS